MRKVCLCLNVSFYFILFYFILFYYLPYFPFFFFLIGIPLIVVKSSGFLGSMRIVKKSHVVSDPRPDFGVLNLGLSSPLFSPFCPIITNSPPFPPSPLSGFWRDIPALEDMVKHDYANLEELNDIEHSHVPYPILLRLAQKKYIEGEV